MRNQIDKHDLSGYDICRCFQKETKRNYKAKAFKYKKQFTFKLCSVKDISGAITDSDDISF